MRNLFFPTTVIDGFFEDPDSIREFGLRQEFLIKHETVPGARSKEIEEINRPLFEVVINKFIKLFFSRQNIEYNVSMRYQLVDSSYAIGAVHRDPAMVTGIIYLNKNNLTGGTKIFRKINLFNDPLLMLSQEEYNSMRKGSKDQWEDLQNRKKIENFNSSYEEVLSVKSVYNRAVFFDSHLYHAADNHFGNDLNDSRLTIIVFINDILCTMYPIQRMHKETITIL